MSDCNLDLNAIYEKAAKYCSGYKCGSYAFCYEVLKLAHDKQLPSKKRIIFNEIKERWDLSNDEALNLLKHLAKFRMIEPEPVHNYLFPKNF